MRTIIDIEAPRSVEAGLPVGGIDALNAHAGTRLGGVDEAAVADIHADVRVRLVAGVVEHQIAWHEVAPLDRRADAALLARSARQWLAPRLLEDMRDQPAAVESGLGRAAAVPVARAEGVQRVREGTHAGGARLLGLGC